LKAYCLLREKPCYRREAFVAGLKAAGMEPVLAKPSRFSRGEVLLIWNRYGEWHAAALQAERDGATVLVAENGYLGAGGTSPKFDVLKGPQPGHYYALAKGGHNGQGVWPTGGPGRWARLGIDLKPWRSGGDYVLVLANRSFGIPGRLMPETWPAEIGARLKDMQRLPVRQRGHPGNDAPSVPLAQDLAAAAAAVVWHSSAGLHALVAGVPVYCDAPHWIGKSAALPVEALGAKAKPVSMPERLPMFERLAWAQWTLDEIASGEPFRLLLEA
jgi:hypothetical protein